MYMRKKLLCTDNLNCISKYIFIICLLYIERKNLISSRLISNLFLYIRKIYLSE